MVSFFKDKSTSAVFALIFLSIALRAFFLIHPPVIVTTADDGLLYHVLTAVGQLPSLLVSILYHIIILVQALRINYVLNDSRMYQKPAFTASLAYVLLTALIPEWNNISAALLANSMIIWLVFRLVKLYNMQQPKSLIYNIGLITGSTLLLYYPALFVVPAIFFALGITRPFRINEWFVLLLGIITPLYFWCGYLFLTGQLLSTLAALGSLFQPHRIIPENIKIPVIAFSVAGLLLIAGVVTWQGNNNRMVIQVRKMWGVLFLMFLLLLPVVFIMKGAWPQALLLACVPGAAFISNAFVYPKRLVSAALFWLMAAAIVYINWVMVKI